MEGWIQSAVIAVVISSLVTVAGWFVARDDFRALVASRDPAALEVQREITRILAAKLRALNAKVRGHPAAEDRPARRLEERNYPSNRPSFDWKAFLPVLPCFEGFDAYEIEELVARASVRELERGAPLFRPGEAASACYIVVRGAVDGQGASGPG